MTKKRGGGPKSFNALVRGCRKKKGDAWKLVTGKERKKQV